MAGVLLAVVGVALVHARLALTVAVEVGLAVDCVAAIITAPSFVGAVAISHRAHDRFSALVFAVRIFGSHSKLNAAKSTQEWPVHILLQLRTVVSNSVGGRRPLVRSAGAVINRATVEARLAKGKSECVMEWGHGSSHVLVHIAPVAECAAVMARLTKHKSKGVVHWGHGPSPVVIQVAPVAIHPAVLHITAGIA